MAGLGLPSALAFGPERPPSGTHEAGQWLVDQRVNTTRVEARSDGGDVRSFSLRPDSYDHMIRAVAARDPDREAVVCGDRRVTWGEFDAMISRVATGLAAAGIGNGARVAVMLDNRLEFILAVLGCIRAGGVAVPLGTRLGPVDVAYIVDHAEPALAVTTSEWLRRFPQTSSIRRTYLVDSDDEDCRFESLLEFSPTTLNRPAREDAMMIVYTSGTTGKPKGVVLSHDNFLHTCLHYLYALGIDEPQRSLLAIPATHIAGFGPLLSVTLAAGGTVVLLREFNPLRVLETIESERVTYSVLVPAMIQLCAAHPDLSSYDLGQWRYCIYGGAIMPPAVIERFGALMPKLRMINAYGATETCAVCTIIPHDMTAFAPDSVGLPLQCDDIIVVDAQGREVAEGESGELWIRGPNVFRSYWKDEVATTEAFTDGYWHSGDVGTRDASGLIYVRDRIKDMVNRGGYKVFSAEIEAALMTHPDVADCAVVGVPHPILGEKTHAFVQDRGGVLSAAMLADYLTARIADYKVPDFWTLTHDPLPRNQNGKLQKGELRDIARAASQKPTST